MLVLAEHIVDKISALCRTLVLLKKTHARIHITSVDASTSNSMDIHESTIRWKQAMDDVLIARGTLLCELTHCSSNDLHKRMESIIDTQYRELVAALMVVMMQEDLTNYRIKTEPGRITVDLILIDSVYTGPSIKQIVEQVAQYYGIDTSAITGKDRNAAMPRKVAIYLIRKLTTHSLDDIIREFNRDRSTVLYALHKIDHDLKAGNAKLKVAIIEITKQLDELI
jgi:hypothetical protein